MIRALTAQLPAGVVITAVAEGRDLFVISDPGALSLLDMERRWELYNQVFSELDGDPAVTRERRAAEVVAEILCLDTARDSKRVREAI